jgi:hypothetical protein
LTGELGNELIKVLCAWIFKPNIATSSDVSLDCGGTYRHVVSIEQNTSNLVGGRSMPNEVSHLLAMWV